MVLNYDHTQFDGGADGNSNDPSEGAILDPRFQLAY